MPRKTTCERTGMCGTNYLRWLKPRRRHWLTVPVMLVAAAFLLWCFNVVLLLFDQDALNKDMTPGRWLPLPTMNRTADYVAMAQQGARPPDEVLNILQNRLIRFANERRNFSAVTCDMLEKTDTASLCHEPDCPWTFSASLKERLDQMLAIQTQLPSEVRQTLETAVQNVRRHQYVFVTGISSRYYGPGRALIQNLLNSVFPQMVGRDFELIVFDLGLEKNERLEIKEGCRCTLLDFPFDGLPQFVTELTCYTWKPLIVASLMEKAEYLVWMDSSVRWSPKVQFDVIFQRVKERGFQVYPNGGSIAVRTNPSMMDFFGDHLCQYAQFDEFDANLFLFYMDRVTKDVIIPSWVSCALNRTCMCLPDHNRLLACNPFPPRTYGRCHRFDQSALSVIFSKLLLDARPMVKLPLGVARVKRFDESGLFE